MQETESTASHFTPQAQPSPEQFAVERTVVDGFGDVMHLNIVCPFQIRYRPAHLQRAVISASAEVELRDGALYTTPTPP